MALQVFVVEVSASIMPPMTENELTEAVTRLAFQKESRHGMGALSVDVRELDGLEAAELDEILDHEE